MRRITSVLIVLLSLSGSALAHKGVEHLRGTVTEITDKAITVQTPAKQTKTVTLLTDTTFLKGKVAASLKAVSVGDRVVIDVVMKGKDMVAKTVKSGAVATKAAAPPKHKTAQD